MSDPVKHSPKTKDLDVLIVGAGPAGLSASIWCADLGFNAAIVEKTAECGGQLSSIFAPIRNYAGIYARDGKELRERFVRSSVDAQIVPTLETELVEFDPSKMSATDRDGVVYTAKFFVFATGVRRRRLNVPGEEKFSGRGILHSGAAQKDEVAGKRIAIIGGGDAAVENALILAETAELVHLIHRRSDFSARKDFIESAAAHPKIEFLMESSVRSIEGDETVSSVRIASTRIGEAEIDLKVDALLIRIGVEPNNELLAGCVELDPKGYVIVDHLGRSSWPGVYAIGDLANPVSPTIATAAGSAASAVKHIITLFNYSDSFQ